MNPIHILRPGKFKARNGKEVSFAAADLAAVAANYDPKLYQSPIVVGHPKHDAPAYGWIKAVKSHGEKLLAEPEKLVEQFAEMVEKGLYKKVSASLFTPNHPSNPKPGEYYLKHVGFLGAAAPAIPGLDPVSLAADENEVLCVEFSLPDTGDASAGDRNADSGQTPETKDQTDQAAAGDKDPVEKLGSENTQEAINLDKEKKAIEARASELSKKEADLTARERGIRRLEFSAFVENLKKDGKVLPAFETDLVSFMEAINDGEAIEFAEAEKTPLDFFKEYLQKQPKVVELAEFAAETDAAPGSMSPEQVAEKATQLRQECQDKGVLLSFSEAVERVVGGDQ
jgi:hypothetical protein